MKESFLNYGTEFLHINDNLPSMIVNKRIFVYSALLNYSYSEINQTTNFKTYLKSFLTTDNIPINWDNIREIFINFLKELSKRTINY